MVWLGARRGRGYGWIGKAKALRPPLSCEIGPVWTRGSRSEPDAGASGCVYVWGRGLFGECEHFCKIFVFKTSSGKKLRCSHSSLGWTHMDDRRSVGGVCE